MEFGEEATSRLLQRAKEGERDALDELYSRCLPRLVGLVRVRLGGGLRAHMESGDILQAALLKSFEKLDDFRGQDTASLLAWLGRIVENEIRDRADWQGRQKRGAGLEVPLATGQDLRAERLRSALSEIILDEKTRRLEAAIAKLPEDQREVVLLRRFEELSFEEVGQRMSRSPDACRMLLARAMTALTLLLAEDAP